MALLYVLPPDKLLRGDVECFYRAQGYVYQAQGCF